MTETEMKWFRLGKLLRRNLMAVKREPVAYSYNGVVLPKLPKTELPYAIITYFPGTTSRPPWYTFRLSSAPVYVKDGYAYHTAPSAFWVMYETETEWGDGIFSDTDSGGATVENGAYLVWANHDVLNEDGSIYLAGSDPVPVYE